MDKGKFYSGLFIMIGLIVIGFHMSGAVGKYRSYDRTVNVKGLCEKEVKADKVIWPVVYKVMANDVQSIYDQTDAGNSAIMSFLESGGIRPSEITVSVPQISDKFANENSIAIELCVNSDGDFAKTVDNAVWLVRELMKRYKIPAEKIRSHRNWTGKSCPAKLLDRWEEFISRCAAEEETEKFISIGELKAMGYAGIKW